MIRHREPVVGDARHERHQADVVVLTDGGDESTTDEPTLPILQQDSAWAWLRDPEEDVYTEADVQSTPGS